MGLVLAALFLSVYLIEVEVRVVRSERTPQWRRRAGKFLSMLWSTAFLNLTAFFVTRLGDRLTYELAGIIFLASLPGGYILSKVLIDGRFPFRLSRRRTRSQRRRD